MEYKGMVTSQSIYSKTKEEQEELRYRLINYLNTTHSKLCDIAKITQIPDSVLSKFKNGKTKLYDESFDTLQNCLTI